MKYIILSLFAAMIATSAIARDKNIVSVTPVSEDADAANGGIIYALPKTAVRITIEAELTIEKVGPYYKYSNRYLNLTNVITENSKRWRITGAKVETLGVADYSRRYKISATETLPAVSLTSAGVLNGINITNCATENVDNDDNSDVIYDVNFDDIQLEKAVLTKTSTAAMAEEAAQAIYRFREKRMSLLGGDDATILHDEGSYNAVMQRLDKLENDYISLFAGRRATFHVVKSFILTPSPNGEKSTVIVRFTENDGFVDAMNIAGQPIYADFTFSNNNVPTYAEDSKQRKKVPVDGLRYIIPGNLNVKIFDRSNLLTEVNVLSAQNGQIATLPASILTDNTKSIIINTINGSLMRIVTK
jgi:hypothetical protein